MSRKKNFSSLIKTSDIPVLVDFYADWCSPCQTLSPIVRQVITDLHEKIRVMKINVDHNRQAAYTFGVRSIPTLVLFHGGKSIWRNTGLITRRKLFDQLNKELKKIS